VWWVSGCLCVRSYLCDYTDACACECVCVPMCACTRTCGACTCVYTCVNKTPIHAPFIWTKASICYLLWPTSPLLTIITVITEGDSRLSQASVTPLRSMLTRVAFIRLCLTSHSRVASAQLSPVHR